MAVEFRSPFLRTQAAPGNVVSEDTGDLGVPVWPSRLPRGQGALGHSEGRSGCSPLPPRRVLEPLH